MAKVEGNEMTIQINPKYWGKAAAGILPMCRKTGRILLTLRSQEVMEPGTWGIPGGKLEPGEGAATGALREFYEETGYKGDVRLFELYTFHDWLHGFAFHTFLGMVTREFSEAKVEESWEVETAAWMTIEEALDIEPKHFGLQAMFDDESSLEALGMARDGVLVGKKINIVMLERKGRIYRRLRGLKLIKALLRRGQSHQ